jgi:tetratricopeptide (TPR) repeat protein
MVTVATVGCERGSAPSVRTLRSHGNNADVYLRSVADTLNDLPNNLDLELFPAQPILTASTSTDGKEVRAICIQNPQSPEEGVFDYLQVVDGNAHFATLQVQPGDIVRFYVQFDEDAAERNIEQKSALELKVRRLDQKDPENALILERGLSGPAVTPQRVEIWRYSDKRAEAIRSMLTVYVNERQPPAGWEPSPDLGALRQLIERANQWLRNLPASDEKWMPEPLLADVAADVTMPEDADAAKIAAAAIAAAVAPANLQDGVFPDGEGRQLEQAVWCRDIAQWARRDAATDFDAAVALFDWTVRNVQLDTPDQAVMIHHPWQALVYGHDTAAQRAWVFVELCRQQQIDAFVIRPRPAEEADAKAKPAPLLVGVMLPDSDAIYLFDPELGLPLPGKDKSVGTLSELVDNPDLLHQFDVEDLPYPVTSEQLSNVDALLVASPLQLSQRARRLEAALKGEESVRLATEVRRQADQLKGLPHVARVALWAQPFQAVADEASLPYTKLRPWRLAAANEFKPFAERPLLWKARVLHFQGNKEIRAAERDDPLAVAREGHQDALKLYQNRSVRLSDDEMKKLAEAKQTVYGAAKSEASYWLGLLSYDRGNFDVAQSWLGGRSLDREPTGKWASGARYNLARTYEAQGKLDEAIKLLEGGPKDGPQRHGNLVRAKRLSGQVEKSANASISSGEAATSAAPANSQ